MRQRSMWLLLLGVVMLVGTLHYSGKVWATTANGFRATTIATGTFSEFEVFNHAVLPNLAGDGDSDGDDKSVWLSIQKTKGLSAYMCKAICGSRSAQQVWPPAPDGTPTRATV